MGGGAGRREGSSPEVERWARLVMDVPGPLRRGAWYPVLSAGPEETVVVVHGRAVILPQHCLEIVNTRPSQWAIVAQASLAPYAVCPSCAERVPLHGWPAQLGCIRCHQTFGVEPADAVAAPEGHATKPNPSATEKRR